MKDLVQSMIWFKVWSERCLLEYNNICRLTLSYLTFQGMITPQNKIINSLIVDLKWDFKRGHEKQSQLLKVPLIYLKVYFCCIGILYFISLLRYRGRTNDTRWWNPKEYASKREENGMYTLQYMLFYTVFS